MRLKLSLGLLTQCLVVFVVLLCESFFANGAYRRNCNAINVGWIWSLPYDLSNTLRLPLGGPLSLILSAGLAIVLFFGMAVSPVYYMLNTPTRHYSQHDAVMLPATAVVQSRQGDLAQSDNMTLADKIQTISQALEPNYIDHLFRFMDLEDETCKKLLVCHAHGFLGYVPSFILRFFSLWSTKMKDIPIDYSEAIKTGFADQGACAKTYSCSASITELVSQVSFGGWKPFCR